MQMEEVGMEKLDNMMKALEEAEDMEQLVEIENNIAFELGEGFLKGKYDYGDMQQIKESVEKTEELQRERMETQEKTRSISHKR